jgi:hypothetical protein
MPRSLCVVCIAPYASKGAGRLRDVSVPRYNTHIHHPDTNMMRGRVGGGGGGNGWQRAWNFRETRAHLLEHCRSLGSESCC